MDQNKWERWAAMLHDESGDSKIGFVDDSEKVQDGEYVKKIFNSRDRVAQALRMRPADKAWNELRKKLFAGKVRLELMKYAAVFIISLMVTGAAFRTFNQRSSNEYTSITSPNGQISNVTLFDGTNVWLNAGSSLKYSHAFNRNNRIVFLEGEALFSVTKNVGRPFIVYAGNVQVKVHGTEFNVKAYGNEAKIEAVLIEGKVEFISPDRSAIMRPGEQLLFSKTTGELIKNRVNLEEYTSWTGGKIYFNNETLLNLTRQLERWYEIKFVFDTEEIKSYRFTGVINKDKSLNYTLNIIQEINKIKFEFKEEQIMIRNK